MDSNPTMPAPRTSDVAARTSEPPVWQDPRRMDQLLLAGDPDADQLITALFDHHGEYVANQMLEQYVNTGRIAFEPGQLEPAGLVAINKYFEDASKPPSWMRPELIPVGQELFNDHGPMIILLLAIYSLPELYTCGHGGTQVLSATLKLTAHVRRRTIETAQMIVDVMGKDGLSPHNPKDPATIGRGIRAALRVRLKHAAIRYLIMKKARENHPSGPVTGQTSGAAPHSLGRVFSDTDPTEWNQRMKEWGRPISQEYMGPTLLTFSYLIIKGLRHYRIPVTEEQTLAYIHTWNVVGHYMGVDPAFLTRVNTMEDAQSMYDAVMPRRRTRNAEEAEPGRQLTAALVDYLTEMIREKTPGAKLIPSSLMRHFPRVLIWDMVGDETAELLGVKLSRGEHFFWQVLQHLPKVSAKKRWEYDKKHPKEVAFARWMSRLITRDLVRLPKEWEKDLFVIPVDLEGKLPA